MKMIALNAPGAMDRLWDTMIVLRTPTTDRPRTIHETISPFL